MKMTLKQHLELGEQIKEFKETLQQTHVMNIGPKASHERRAVANTLKRVDLLKCALDGVVCRDFPQCAGALIYYGMSQAWLARQEAK